MNRRPGFALLVSLLLAMALALLGAGMLAVAAREAEVAAAMAARSRARAAAEAAARAALAGWSTRRHRELALGEATAMEAPVAGPNVRVRRLDATLFLLEATALPDRRAPAAARAAALVRTVDTGALALEFMAAVMAESEAAIHRGQVSGGDACGRLAPVAGVMAPTVVVEPEAAVSGAPEIATAELPAPAFPELFAPPLIDRLATINLRGGSISPRPRIGADECLPDSLNWGAVSALSACHGHLPLVRSATDLQVRGGEGRGMLVVDGNLDLEGVRFHGAILVSGHLTVGQGTVIQGALRARGLTLLDGSIVYDACAVDDAVSSGGLNGPVRPGERWWLPAF